MDGHVPQNHLEQVFGVVLILVVLVDIFLTVLYARIGSGIIRHRVACSMWWIYRSASKPFGRYRSSILVDCGSAYRAIARVNR